VRLGLTVCTRWVYPLQKKEAAPGEKPEPVRTHLRNMIIVPEMIGSMIGVYNGKTFNQVEIKVRPVLEPVALRSALRSSLHVLTLLCPDCSLAAGCSLR
jgi:hypothetical protein